MEGKGLRGGMELWRETPDRYAAGRFLVSILKTVALEFFFLSLD